jgi:hypothetical protein
MALQSVARGAPRSGDRTAAGSQRRGRQTAQESARGEPTARYGVASSAGRDSSPSAVSPDFTATRMGRGLAGGLPCQAPSEGNQPFASSPFAHPIPQGRRRASGDLFSAFLSSGRVLVFP